MGRVSTARTDVHTLRRRCAQNVGHRSETSRATAAVRKADAAACSADFCCDQLRAMHDAATVDERSHDMTLQLSMHVNELDQALKRACDILNRRDTVAAAAAQVTMNENQDRLARVTPSLPHKICPTARMTHAAAAWHRSKACATEPATRR